MVVFLALLAWWLWLPALIGLFWGASALFWPGVGYQNAIEAWVYNSFLHGNVLWIFVLIWSLVSLVIAFWMGDESDNDSDKGAGAIFGIANTALFVLSIGLLIWFNVNLDKYEANYYAKSATFYVQDATHVPQPLRLLTGDGASKGDGCDVRYHGKNNDSVGCIKTGDLPPDAWVPRIGSHDTAVNALENSSGIASGTNLDKSTVAYLNGEKSGVWSGVLDGSGISVPMAGVAEWNGQGIATQCGFTGDYALDRSFTGGKSNSLMNLFHERWPLLSFQQEDEWGYCKDMGDGKPQQPFVVLPVTEPVPYSHRTVDAAAGVVVIHGDHGKTVMDYDPDVKPGEYPGPVYPASLTSKQRDFSNWAAGRQNQDRNHFGFEPTDDTDVQSGTVSEFLLEDQKTHRLEYVTPLTLNGSSSQLFVAFAVSFADEVHRGQLNPVSIYVYNDNDNRRVPIKTLVSAANNWLAINQPWLKANGSTLKEFEPINGDTWRAYLENNNQVQYMLDVQWDGNPNNASHLAKTVLVQANGQPAAQQPAPSAATATTPGAPAPAPNAAPGQPGNDAMCGNPASLSPQQLSQCITDLVSQLAGRAAPAAAPSH